MSFEVFICGGGTGGHYFSGIAVAEKILQLYPDAKIQLIGTRQGIEARYPLDDTRMSVSFIAAKGVKGKGLIAKCRSSFFLMSGVLQSIAMLIRARPRLVMGVGGYASFPTLLAAFLLKPFCGWKIAVLEQNSFAGLVNRFFSKLGVRSLAAFPLARFQLVDLPLRKKFVDKALVISQGFRWPPKNILILGGSQGAHGLNEAWKKNLPPLIEKYSDIHVTHQTGKADEQSLQEFYKKLPIQSEVFAFSDKLPNYYQKADLIVCRAGAMTVFETMAFRKPVIFIPFPAATDNHQTKNALAVQSPDWVIAESDFSCEKILKLLALAEPSLPSCKKLPLQNWTEILRDLLENV